MSEARILLVDDEEPLLRLLKTYLSRFGHHVTCASSGKSALQVLELASEPFHVAILDMWLPDTDGLELITRVLAGQPGIKILVASGAPVQTEQIPFTPPQRVAFLQKPFLPRTLMESVDSLLGE